MILFALMEMLIIALKISGLLTELQIAIRFLVVVSINILLILSYVRKPNLPDFAAPMQANEPETHTYAIFPLLDFAVYVPN